MKKVISIILACVLLQSCATVEHSISTETTRNFTDKYIDIGFDASATIIQFSLRNRSDKEIILDWDNVRFIDLSGRSSKVMHSGVSSSQRFDKHAPASIAPHTTLDDFMSPVTGPLFIYQDEVEKPTSKKVKVKMPIIMDGQSKEYIFNFDPKELYMKDKEIIEKVTEDSLYE